MKPFEKGAPKRSICPCWCPSASPSQRPNVADKISFPLMIWMTCFDTIFSANTSEELAAAPAAAELLMPIPTWHNSFGHNSFGKWMHKKFSFFPFEDFRSTDLFYRMTNSIGIMEKIWKNVKKKAGWGLRKIVVPFFSSTTALILKCDNNSLDRVPRFPFVLFHSHTSRTHSRRKPHLRAPV